MAGTDGKPGRDCPRCSRLATFRKTWRAKEPTCFNAPVPSFGRLDARLLIVGLAPGLQGANRTGRPFTGDYAGVLLYDTLARYGFVRGSYGARSDACLPRTNRCPLRSERAGAFSPQRLPGWQICAPLLRSAASHMTVLLP